jgi:hypothetical protein
MANLVAKVCSCQNLILLGPKMVIDQLTKHTHISKECETIFYYFITPSPTINTYK